MINSTKESKEVLENKVNLYPNQIFFTILSISVFLVTPSAFAEEIPILLETNKENYEFGDPILLHVTVEKVIPNTSLKLQIFKDDFPIQREPLDIIPKLKDNSGHHLFWRLNDQPSGNYEIFVYYGAKTYQMQDDKRIVTDSLGSNSIKIKYNSELSSNAKFLEENFMVDEFDVGTELWISELQSYPFPRITFCEINFCYDSMIAKQFGISNYVRVEIFEFKDASTTKKFYSKLLEDPLEYIPQKITEIDIKEGFECGTAYVFHGFNEYAIICNVDNKLFRIFIRQHSYDPSFNSGEQANIFAEAISGKIAEKITVLEEKKLAGDNIIDSKSPELHADHTIEEVIGLEIKSKIPEWVKNIFGWYSQGQIGDEELIKALQFLIKEGIIQV